VNLKKKWQSNSTSLLPRQTALWIQSRYNDANRFLRQWTLLHIPDLSVTWHSELCSSQEHSYDTPYKHTTPFCNNNLELRSSQEHSYDVPCKHTTPFCNMALGTFCSSQEHIYDTLYKHTRPVCIKALGTITISDPLLINRLIAV